MNAVILGAATAFVDLVLKHLPLQKSTTFDEAGVKVLFDVVATAGFEPKKIVLGNVDGYVLEDDGSRTGKTFPLNRLCAYIVISQNGQVYEFATAWLNQLFSYSILCWDKDRMLPVDLADKIATEIERSVPFKPIRLTAEGDLLRENQPEPQRFGSGHFVDHKRDDTKLPNACSVGHHSICGGSFERRQTSERYDALFCRTCYLRVTIPHEVQTYGELRKYFKNEMDAIEGQAGPE